MSSGSFPIIKLAAALFVCKHALHFWCVHMLSTYGVIHVNNHCIKSTSVITVFNVYVY